MILQEYIPEYRVAFFETLQALCAAEGIALTVASGRANADQALRGDGASLTVAEPILQREWLILGRRVVLRKTREVLEGADLVIMEQARRNADAYRLLLPRRPGSLKIALWGHGRDYTRPTKVWDRTLQRLLTTRAAWFFAYTQGGADAVAAQGVNRAKITVVQNSIDTAALRASIDGVSAVMMDEFNRRHNLRGRTALFVGALDESKRLSFLVDAARLCYSANPDFRLLVAGDGPLRSWLEGQANTFPWLGYLGALTGDSKALALASSQVLAMPGRVGLVAVDSFSAQIPIVTTNWQWHAPEFEYLIDGTNAVVSVDSTEEYSGALSRVLDDPALLLQLGAGCARSSEEVTIDAMAMNFLGGIRGALGAGRA
ncbi:glycosyltransferase family 4 protein [Cryobacterium sp. SO2]|uniref:glycosyltransferase family 4 protein n=1 Tax=Cryobacterium sp. SO2 TaxID=1897060 RepID=UPI00223E627E|nr:glycosyltransferase family 4 protein [Cryobacterium sp. SO2]WEO77981.1 glycosyltransferase family 4 protein [Cryobacterium sp. SO2]